VRTRLSLIAAAAAVIGLGLASVVAYVATSRALAHEVDQSLQAPPVPAADGVLRFPSSDEFCGNAEEDQPSLGLYNSQLVRPDGTPCPATGEAVVLPEDRSDFGGAPGEIVLRDGRFVSGGEARVAEVRLPDGSVLVVARDLDPMQDVLRILSIALAAVVLAGAVAAWFLTRWAVGAGMRPVTRFAAYAETVAAAGTLRTADLPPPPPGSGNDDELARLSKALDAMMTSLRNAQDRLQQLVADGGHELRTPLASLRSNVALLRRSRRLGRPLPAEDEDQLLGDLEEQTIELADLVDDLVQLTAADGAPSPTEEVRFDECVARAVRRAELRGRDHRFEVDLEPWSVLGDATRLERAVVNLLDNAVKFSPAGTAVRVTLTEGTLSVSDQGPGIAAEHAERAFERFWRAPADRSRPGSGLGLAMVAETARLHRGWADLGPSYPSGTTARLFLPGRSATSPRG
jgi:two-component system, OmpR family, sensor histidine kinase MprB